MQKPSATSATATMVTGITKDAEQAVLPMVPAVPQRLALGSASVQRRPVLPSRATGLSQRMLKHAVSSRPARAAEAGNGNAQCD